MSDNTSQLISNLSVIVLVFFIHVEGGESAFGTDFDIVAGLFQLFAAGRGMGKAFFGELPTLIPAARYRLEIEPDNARAEKLYRAMGFDVLEYKQMVLDTLED